MRIFVSAGEPSGDLHAANLIQSLRKRLPDAEFVGFGGDRMEQAGATLLYPLVTLAVMWFGRVLLNIHKFFRLLYQADQYFLREKPDAVILIDFPGFHWWVARRAKARGIPVFYYVPPQLWAWAGWRVKKVRKFVDHVLCSLPFEPAWYHKRGVSGAVFVGHPYFGRALRADPRRSVRLGGARQFDATRGDLAWFPDPGVGQEPADHASRRDEARRSSPRRSVRGGLPARAAPDPDS